MNKCFKELYWADFEAKQKNGEKMSSLFSKSRLLGLLALLSLNTFSSSLMGDCCCDPCATCDNNRMYIGAFGGAIYSDSSNVYQMGTAFFTEAQGGPLAVYGQGRLNKTSTGFGGVQIGYEMSKWGCSDWALASAVEIEGYWYKHSKKGHLTNPTNRLPEHDFLDTFKLDSGVYLVNAVFALNNRCYDWISPYVGAGVGAARLSIKNASSLQVDPVEEGINHFNSRTNDSTWAFAAQVKAGLRFNICNSFHIFGEYRYLFLDASNYIFGSTVYDTHAPTSPWNVRIQSIQHNAFVVGLQYDL